MHRSGSVGLRFCFILILSYATVYGGKPDWVEKRPIIAGTYVGIGMMQKNQPASTYTLAAKNIALNDIASQITVTVSGDLLRKVFESNERLSDEFVSSIRASAKADLDDVQLVDTYEDDDEYWVYLQITKAAYEARRAAKMRNAVSISLDHATQGRKNEREGMVVAAMGSYARAFTPLEKYLSEPVEVQLDGRNVLLVNELYNSLQNIISNIELRAESGKMSGKVSRPLRKPLEFVAELAGPVKKPVGNLPFQVRFSRGSGEVVDHLTTDRHGKGTIEIQKITSPVRIQTVDARMDVKKVLGLDTSASATNILLNSFPVPQITFELNVSGVDVFVETQESMFGQKLNESSIEPVLKSQLGENGFEFVNDKSQASLIINLNAQARKGTEVRGLAFAFVSATVSVYDRETQREIFKSSIEDVKEGSNNFEKAAYKGFQTIAERIVDELMPKLVDKVQQ